MHARVCAPARACDLHVDVLNFCPNPATLTYQFFFFGKLKPASMTQRSRPGQLKVDETESDIDVQTFENDERCYRVDILP